MFIASLMSVLAPMLLAHGSSSSTLRLVAPTERVPVIGLPHLSMPKFQLPGRRKKDRVNAPLALVDRRLRTLVGQQEAWYSDHGRYGVDVDRMDRGRARADTSLDRVQVQVLFATRQGWTAMATHPGAPGKTCVVYVGFRDRLPIVPRTRADANEATAEARPACDR